jgi:hypothetical protein
MNNLKVAAAVALAIGSVSAAHAATPTAAQCGAPGASLFVAGSSAAQNAFSNALATDLFGGTANLSTFSGTNGNFKAYCGFAATGNTAGITANTVVTVHYRAEGGSVVGALPIVSGKSIKFLDLTQAACQIAAPVVNGTSATVGTTDGWTGCLTSHAVEMGVTDLEPTVFVPPNYPSAYSATVFGTANGTQLAGLTSTKLFQQVFGIYVNTNGINGGGTGQALNLSKETVATILAGNYTDWSQVPAGNGTTAAVSSVSAPITVINREAGSGTRTGASIYFLNTNCGAPSLALQDLNPSADGFATGDVLNTASSTPGGLTYASIDNASKTNMTNVTLSGVTPSNLTAASGQYDWWFEATAQKGNITSPGGTTIYNWLIGGELGAHATAPHTAQINAIPGFDGNGNALAADTLGGHTIYTNPFTRGGKSCTLPVL